MKISEDLKALIDATLADGKITKKEKKVLFKKAEKEGIDLDEFEVYLDSVAHGVSKSKNDDNQPFIKKVIYHRPEGYKKKEIKPGVLDTLQASLTGGVEKEYEDVYQKAITIRVYHLLMVLVIVLGITGFVFSRISAYESEQNELMAKFGCTSFDDCLSKYQFDGAYHYYNEMGGYKRQELRELISVQVTFWSDKKDFGKAYSVLSEYTFDSSYKLATDDEKANDDYNSEASFYNEQISELVFKMKIANEPMKEILNYAKLFKPIVVGNESDKDLLGNYNSYRLSEEPYDSAIEKLKEQQ